MLAVAGILVQEIVKPDVFFYSAGVPENLPNINFGGPTGGVRHAHASRHCVLHIPSPFASAGLQN